jgi:crossover junction endodeoxyribonuclease RusA
MTPFTVTLPWPARELSPNSRRHWRVKAEATQQARQDAYLATRAMPFDEIHGRLWVYKSIGEPIDIVARYTFNPPDKRRRDIDNCLSSCKAYQDGVMDALGIDDRQIKRTIIEWGIVEREKGGEVVLELQAIGDNDG